MRRVPASVDPDEFASRFASQPCVIEGGQHGWHAATAWTPDELARTHGHVRGRLEDRPDKTVALSDFLANAARDEFDSCYIFDGRLPYELASDMRRRSWPRLRTCSA